MLTKYYVTNVYPGQDEQNCVITINRYLPRALRQQNNNQIMKYYFAINLFGSILLKNITDETLLYFNE